MERLILLKQDLHNLLINPMWVFYSTLFPFLLVVVMGYLSRDLFGEEVSSYACLLYTSTKGKRW